MTGHLDAGFDHGHVIVHEDHVRKNDEDDRHIQDHVVDHDEEVDVVDHENAKKIVIEIKNVKRIENAENVVCRQSNPII